MMVETRKWAFAIVLAAVFFAVPGARADTITGSSGAAWESWSTSDLNNDGSPYWDSRSWDGTYKNIGYCLTTSNCGLVSPPGALPYWGKSDGTTDPGFYFNSTSTSNAAVQLAIAGNASFNIFGWYDTTNPGTLHPLFTGAGPGTTIAFTPSASYGFYLDDPVVGGIWYTQSSLNASDQRADQHFAVFDQGSAFWIGAEDLRLSNSDRDYQDLVLTVTPVTPVPEPATLTLLGTGLLGIGMALKRRRAARKL